MNETLMTCFGLTITPMKLLGYLGVLLFGGRWVIQIIASHKVKKSTFPLLFWYMSLSGSALLLIYFTFGKNDSVGILSNLFPAVIAGYNLFLELKKQPKEKTHSEE